MIHDKTIRVGACDWDHPHWQGSFYPDDLPSDWRLSYYANEFSVVLVPQLKWRAQDADFEQWAEDAPEGFRFYFLTDDTDIDDALIRKELGDAFAGFVPVNANGEVALIRYADNDLRGWKEWLQETDVSTIFLMDKNLNIKQLSEFHSLVELMGL
jgi:uncharacterized protein YecE (DUF72 family)